MTSATIFPDTTILIQYQSLDHVDWRAVLKVKHVKIVLTSAVLQEIEEIKNQDISPTLARKASDALAAVSDLLKEDAELPEYLSVEEAETPKINFGVEQLDPNSVADLLVATMIAYQRTHALEFVALFSDDSETRVKANTAGFDVASLPKSYLNNGAANKSEAQQNSEAPHVAEESGEKSGLFAPSTKKLATPTPLFKNKLIHEAHQPATPPEVPAEPATEEEKPNKLFEVLNEEEAPVSAQLVEEKEPTETQDNLPLVVATSPEEPEEVAEQASQEEELPVESKPEVKAPFVAIKQERARPDHAHKRYGHGPKKPSREQSNGQHQENGQQSEQAKLPPLTARITSKSNGVADDAPPIPKAPEVVLPKPQRQSISFSSKPINTDDEQSEAPATEQASEYVEEKPDLRLAFEGDDTRSAIIIHHPEYPSIDEVTERIARLRKSYPKLAMLGNSSGDGVGSGIPTYNGASSPAQNDLVFQRRNSRIQRYNSALDTYYTSSEKYLSEIAEFENLKRRSARLDLMLINELPDSLKSLYIAIHFPSNLRVYSEDTLPEQPVGPNPPEEPNLDALFDQMRLPRVPIPGELSGHNNDIKMRSRNLAPVEVRWNKGWDVIYSMREIEKNEHIPFNPLYIVFNSFEHATSFRIQFRITVASASYEERGDLEVLVRKEI